MNNPRSELLNNAFLINSIPTKEAVKIKITVNETMAAWFTFVFSLEDLRKLTEGSNSKQVSAEQTWQNRMQIDLLNNDLHRIQLSTMLLDFKSTFS